MALVADLLTLHAGLNDMLETEHASAPQFPKHATGRQAQSNKKHKHARPAFARRVSGPKRAFGIPDMFRPVDTLTEHAMFVDLLPAFTKGSRVEGYAMAREWNLRVLHSHKIKNPLDASLKHEHKLKDFAKAFVKATRRKQSLMPLLSHRPCSPWTKTCSKRVTMLQLLALHGSSLQCSLLISILQLLAMHSSLLQCSLGISMLQVLAVHRT